MQDFDMKTLFSVGGDITVSDPVTSGLETNVTLQYDPLRAQYSGLHVCMAELSSSALLYSLNASATEYINVLPCE